MTIAVLDTNILIYFFERLYNADKGNFQRAVDYFRTRSGELWIPGEVRREFVISRSIENRLYRIVKRHEDLIKICPITTSKHERNIIINDIDPGEADAIVQIEKAISKRKYRNRNFVFVSEDKDALRFAEGSGFEILKYKEIKQELQEIGVMI